MPASLPSGVRLRGSTYQLRIGVPDDIRHLWPRRADGSLAIDAYRASLKTSSRNEAAARAHAIIADYHRQFESLRESARAPTPNPVTDALVEHIAAMYERDLLHADEAVRANPNALALMVRSTAPRGFLTGRAHVPPATSEGPIWGSVGDYLDPVQHTHVSDIHRALLRALKADYAIGRLEQARDAAERVCDALAIRVDWDQPTGRRGLLRILRAMIRTAQAMVDRDQGEPIETPAAPKITVVPVLSSEATGVKEVHALSDVIPSWINRNSPKQDAISRTKRAVALFEQVTRGIPLTELRKAHGAAFVAWLLSPDREFGRKTAGNIAAAVTAVMNVAVKDDLIERNPMDLGFDKTIGAERREPWTDEELKLMLSSPLFSDQMATVPRWANVDPEDGRALLMILLHTGARLGEVGQLRCEDFATRSGLHCVRFTAEAGTLKTAESERTVPLPSHLVDDLWFAGWLKGVQVRTGLALPSLNGRVKGVSDVGARWFAQFREATGLPAGKLKGSHRFRHWIRTALNESGCTTETADAITGHAASGSSGRRVYTATASLPTMFQALNAVAWPEQK